MSLTMHLDLAKWQGHIDQVAAQTPGLVPVAKGNGYGFGLERLAGQAERLGVDCLAVGTPDEVAAVRPAFGGQVLVLQPWRPGKEPVEGQNLIRTISRPEDLRAAAELPGSGAVVVELATAMKRHGLTLAALTRLTDELDRVDLAGWAIHPPMASQRYGRGLAESLELGRAAREVRPAPVWLSHLTTDQYQTARTELGESRLRLGTSLWMSAPGAYRVTADVLDVHPVVRGERVGYWQHKVPGPGHLVVVSGGTADGVALAAPSRATGLRQRGRTAAKGLAEALGRNLSPFTIAGRKRWLIEPPHMQVSLVYLPVGVPPPGIGDEVPVTIRLTTANIANVVLV
jgi:alanine racemase